MPDVVPARLKLRAVLYGLGALLRVRAGADQSFRALLARRDAVFQIRLADGSEARWFAVSGGEVTCKAGVHSHADAALVFGTPQAALTMLSLRPDYLGRIEAAKNFQLSMEGDDAVVAWMLKVLSRAAGGEPEYGIDLGGGVRRYTNNTNGGPVHVDVKDGRILRVTPIEFTDEDAPSWSITARGRKFTPPRKTSLAPTRSRRVDGLLARSAAASAEARRLRPARRPQSRERAASPATSPSAGTRRSTSWPASSCACAASTGRARCSRPRLAPHVGQPRLLPEPHRRFFNTVGSTRMMHNPDSWEGWAWGAEHHWGHSMRAAARRPTARWRTCLQECEMVVFWSSDPEATSGIYGGHGGHRAAPLAAGPRHQLRPHRPIPQPHRRVARRQVAGAADRRRASRWPTPSPGCGYGGPVRQAVRGAAHHRVRKAWRGYILGADDGVAKTPEWQEAETGVPRARCAPWRASGPQEDVPGLRRPREHFGGACRSATGIEWARAMVCLMAMRGLGKPGINMGNLQLGAPVDTRFYFPGYSRGRHLRRPRAAPCWRCTCTSACRSCRPMNPVGQTIPRLRIPEAMLDGRAEGYAFSPTHRAGPVPPLRYPDARVLAGASSTTSTAARFFGTMTRDQPLRRVPTARTASNSSSTSRSGSRARRSSPTSSCPPARITSAGTSASGPIPAAISMHGLTQCNNRVIVMQHKCIEPLGESQARTSSIFAAIASAWGSAGALREGQRRTRVVQAAVRSQRPAAGACSWREFLKKGYYVVPPPAEGTPKPVAYRWFAEGRPKDTPDLQPLPGDYAGRFREGLQTQSGKIEFVSSSLKRFDPDDPERPPLRPVPAVLGGPGQPERAVAQAIPCRWSRRIRASATTPGRRQGRIVNDMADHRVLVDGHYYWIVRINRRMPPRAASPTATCEAVQRPRRRDSAPPGSPSACRRASCTRTNRPPCTSRSESPASRADLGGCVNILTPSRPIAAKTHSMAPNSCLIEVEPWVGAGVSGQSKGTRATVSERMPSPST